MSRSSFELKMMKWISNRFQVQGSKVQGSDVLGSMVQGSKVLGSMVQGSKVTMDGYWELDT
jgi:hypothetical protein